jgi:hypothetical protein
MFLGALTAMNWVSGDMAWRRVWKLDKHWSVAKGLAYALCFGSFSIILGWLRYATREIDRDYKEDTEMYNAMYS